MTGPASASAVRHLADVASIAGVDVPQVVLPADHQVIVGDMRLHYLDWEGPADDVIVFLHGGGLNAHTWDIVCLALRDEHRCYALDLRGHGDSEWSPSLDYGLEANLRDLEGFIDHLGIRRVTLVGQSLGGAISMLYAARHPDRTAALVAVDVGPFVRTEAGLERIRTFGAGRTEFDSLDEAVDYAIAFNPRRHPRLLRYSMERALRRLPDGRWTWKRDSRDCTQARFEDLKAQVRALEPEVRRIRCPVLVLHGAESDVFSADEAEEFASLVGEGRWVTVPGAGHNIQGDNPAGLLEAVRPFFAASP